VPKIAISYRRADTEVMAGRIRDRLADRYGENAVFMDIDNIPFGKDFRVHISEAIVQSDVLLVIVGQRWLGAGRGGARRMDEETDFVRLEVETAMKNAVPIIPVLVGSARMPQPAQLPESLKNFAFLNAAPVDTGRDFREHMERLIRSIDQIWPDRGARSAAASGSRDEVAPPTGPAQGDRDGDPSRLDLSVFSDAAFAPELVVIPAGDFTMGSAEDEKGRSEHEGPQHRVTIARRFAIGRYPVTFDEYDRFCEATGREKPADATWGRGRRPVINVGWDHAQAYIAWLSRETGPAYRLPSEAEWEYACRAGTTTRYSFGDAITTSDANCTDSGLGRTSEVGAYPPNRWGLHDMHGNVFEWIEDDWQEDYRAAPVDGSAWKDPETSTSWHMCVLRGGSWNFVSGLCRSACRVGLHSEVLENNIGFRVVRTLS
jgi:formylglycine-generating enzyme required for sulfatase activity